MGMVERTCWCGTKFRAREADVKRGWAKACCKSHAAHSREKKLDRNDYKYGGQKRQHDDRECDDYNAGMDCVEVSGIRGSLRSSARLMGYTDHNYEERGKRWDWTLLHIGN